MPDILLFGATGYTGKMVASVLGERGASFAVAGRNAAKLRAVADSCGAEDVRIAEAGDLDGLVEALDGVKVLLTCVGPFTRLGATAAEAAIRAGTHYVDSTGETPFVRRLVDEFSDRAAAADVAMAPALGFDEVPADVAATLASEGIDNADVVLTYALPKTASAGTLRSMIGVIGSEGSWVEDGRPRSMRAGDDTRWAPMPPPLGPKASVAFPLAEGVLAPLHLELRSLKTFVTVGSWERIGLKVALPAARVLLQGPVQKVVEGMIKGAGGPDDAARTGGRWTVLAEASSPARWRNVALEGTDVYGLTARTLARAAMTMSAPGYDRSGVMAPVEAIGLDELRDELVDHGVSVQIFEAKGD